MSDRFHHFLAERYPIVRSQFPGEGRRKWRLRVIEDLWMAPGVQAEITSGALNSQQSQGDAEADYENDEDPLDQVTDCGEVGLLIRTDFSDDEAWNAFVRKLQEAEKDFLTSVTKREGEDAPGDEDVELEDDTVESDSGSECIPDHIIKIVSRPGDPQFDGISNLTALRLLNEVDIRLAPLPPSGTSRITPSNRLIDRNGLQEIYRGKTIWIYDRQSNTDESVRLVNQEGDMYGTATGDSWRARVSHVPELQFGMSCYHIKIDFGGLDGWDFRERTRNLNEAESR